MTVEGVSVELPEQKVSAESQLLSCILLASLVCLAMYHSE
jgi:hypothetical protein